MRGYNCCGSAADEFKNNGREEGQLKERSVTFLINASFIKGNS